MGGFVEAIFGGGSSPPQQAEPAPAPSPDNKQAELAKAAAETRKKNRTRTGRQATNTTGGSGVTDVANTTKTTLGS